MKRTPPSSAERGMRTPATASSASAALLPAPASDADSAAGAAADETAVGADEAASGAAVVSSCAVFPVGAQAVRMNARQDSSSINRFIINAPFPARRRADCVEISIDLMYYKRAAMGRQGGDPACLWQKCFGFQNSPSRRARACHDGLEFRRAGWARSEGSPPPTRRKGTLAPRPDIPPRRLGAHRRHTPRGARRFHIRGSGGSSIRALLFSGEVVK